MDLQALIADQGFAILPALLTTSEQAHLQSALAQVTAPDAVRTRRETYAIRNLLQLSPAITTFVQSPKIRDLAAQALGETAIPVRATLFDKTPDANWLVPWHQDLTIAVQHKVHLPGFGPWTTKAGVPHVQPPEAILDSMLAIRIHLDDCGPDNGALRVIPGSHRQGRLSSEQIDALAAAREPHTCTVPSGGALLMKPLLLHASSAALAPSHRRVIHVEFAATPLPAGLRWLSEPAPAR